MSNKQGARPQLMIVGARAQGYDEPMNQNDRYLDARLEGIEKKIDARLDAMQRIQDQADARTARLEQDLLRSVGDIKADNKNLRMVVITSTLTVVLTVLGLFIGFVQISQSTIAEQNAWLRQSVDRIESSVAAPAPPPEPKE